MYYKVLTQDTELLSTFDRPQHNLQRGTTRAKLEIELPQIAPWARIVTTERAIKMIKHRTFAARSMRADKSLTVGKMMTSLLGDAFKNFDFDPVQPRGTRENEIVNQTPDSARTALAQNHIEVTDVKPVSSLGASGGARVITGYPLSLRAQDRVTLYEDNGVVKYYTRDPAPKASADEQTVARIDGDVQSVKARVAGLDEMRVEIANVKTANAEIAARAAEEAGQAQTQAEELARLRTQLAQVQQVGAQRMCRSPSCRAIWRWSPRRKTIWPHVCPQPSRNAGEADGAPVALRPARATEDARCQEVGAQSGSPASQEGTIVA
jgi:hypothetical protein